MEKFTSSRSAWIKLLCESPTMCFTSLGALPKIISVTFPAPKEKGFISKNLANVAQ
jgi:hypothetical protein